MSRRFRIVLIVCLIAAAGGLIWFAISSGSVDDPVYHGRRLSSWLDDVCSVSVSKEQHRAAQEALREMGSNAIPFLIRLADAEDSPTKLKLMGWLKRHHVSIIHLTSARDRNFEAIEVFEILGTRAKPAIPALSKLLNDADSSGTAAQILGNFGPDGIGPLTNASTNMNYLVRAVALSTLGELPTPIFQGKNPVNPAEDDAEVKAIVPVLIGAMSDKEAEIRISAAYSLGRLGRDPSNAVPALVNSLSDTNRTVRFAVVWALAQFGTNAKPAVPALIQALSNDDQGFRIDVTAALQDIDPSAAAKAGVK